MELFVAIAVTHFIALLSPGPDFFLILTTLIKSGKHAAVRVCCGIAFGNAAIIAFVFIGLQLLISIDKNVLIVIKWIGILYLLYLSYLCIRYAKSPLNLTHANDSNICKGKLRLIKGVQSSIFNPKNILFYSSLSVLIAEKFNWYEKLSISIWMVMVVLGWNLFLVRILTFNNSMQFLQRNSCKLYYVSGGAFCIFSILLIGYA
ncbi:LysE family translocator [Acinetobacter baylyi]|uniref:LysE family translocator n=1 Tax=Acinetobacter baylyi TaxID=202950 RepID=UPI0031D1BB87